MLATIAMYTISPFTMTAVLLGVLLIFSVILLFRCMRAKNKSRKELERQLEHSKEELTRSIRLKDKFLSIISHDLRTPFNTILGFSELLIENYDNHEDDEKVNMIKYIHTTSQNLFRLVDNMLHWSKSQSGEIEINKKQTNLHQLVEEEILIQLHVASGKNIILLNETDESIELELDRNIISTVVRNLISNAIKFTHAYGRIEISATEKEKEVLVCVKDDGIGIEKNQLEKIFNMDELYSNKGTQDEKGTGLGLVICKEFVEKHGGSIRVESQPKKGSNFYFTISK